MTNPKIAETFWLPNEKLIITHISGDVGISDVERWEASLHGVLSHLSAGDTFKIFVNLHGFKPLNFEVHKRFRSIIPLTLARYGWKTGYADLFRGGTHELGVKITRGIRCIGAAHCHHDASRIAFYESRFGGDKEHYFTDPAQAREWIDSLEIMELVMA